MPTDFHTSEAVGWRAKWLRRLLCSGQRGVVAATAVAFVAAGVSAAWARPSPRNNFQERQARQQERRARQERKAQQRQARAQHRGDAHQHPPQFFERLRDLPPEEQERVLSNDARFHQLPPERQQQIRENLRRWNSLTPEQQQAMRKDEEFIHSLAPEKRADLRALTSSEDWHQLPAERRQAIVGAFRQMRTLSPAERQAFLESPDTQKNFSPQERSILSRLNGVLQ